MKAFAVFLLFAVTICNNALSVSTTDSPRADLSFPGCGRKFEIGESPWLARIKVENGGRSFEERLCYGVVISNVSILTSAFCLDQALHVRQIKVTFSHNFFAQPKSPEDFVIHQNYDLQGLKNNIAVLNFENSLLGDKVWPICLWRRDLEKHGELIRENNGQATVIGENVANSRRRQKGIRTGVLQVTRPRACMAKAMEEEQAFLDFGRICLTSAEGNFRVCLEGRGTPMQFKIDGKWFLRGLQDKRIQPLDSCASAITTYTDVARHLQFISIFAKELVPGGFQGVQDEKAKSTFNDEKCGKPGSDWTHLVANGSPTEIGDFPWQIAMYYWEFEPDNVTLALAFHCGGALISNKFILTAAHCLLFQETVPYNLPDFRIVVGETFKIRLEQEVPQNHFFLVEKFIPHPQFKGGNKELDIGLVKLKGPVQFSTTVSPICIWPDSASITKILGKHAKVAGMGLMEGHKSAERLQMATLPILDNDDCSRIATGTNDYMICAGFTNGTGVCNGDSGSPLLLEDNGRFFVRGIVSRGKSVSSNSSLCDYTYTALYTDVAQHRKWISNNSDVDFEYFEKPFVPATFNQAFCGKPVFTNESLPLSQSGLKEKASITEFPWTVQIYAVRHFDSPLEPYGPSQNLEVRQTALECTGALVSSKYVLTAAHCVVNYRSEKIDTKNIILGLGKTDVPEKNYSSHSLTYDIPFPRKAKRTVVHSDFVTINPLQANSNLDISHDIALIELEEEVDFSDSVLPICIWNGPEEQENIIGRDAQFAGWGYLVNYTDPDQLYKLSLPILPETRCSEIKGNKTHPMICAGSLDSNNPCDGDDGGPLMLMENGRFYARGILSRGKRKFNDPFVCDLNYPNLFVDILRHRKWIEENSDIKFDI